MKKTGSFVVAVLAALSFNACNGKCANKMGSSRAEELPTVLLASVKDLRQGAHGGGGLR